jgi:hypothetical protein
VIHGPGGDINTYAVNAVANIASLHVSASSNYTVTGEYALALGVVSFTDDIVVTSPTHVNGTSGLLAVGYVIDGTNSASGATANAFLQVDVSDYDITNPANPVFVKNSARDFPNSSVNGSFTTPAILPFIYGKKFELVVSMQATTGTAVDAGVGYSTPDVTGSGSSQSNFFNTLIINSLQSNDNATDLAFAADSGVGYTQEGVVPEPATIALTGFALVAIGLAGRRIKQK